MNEQTKGLIEIKLKKEEDFLKIKETLTRIGVASKRDKTLYQSCHILHKQGKYYIVHFKELFALDGKPTVFDLIDQGRRNSIVRLLEEWNLVEVVVPFAEDTPTVPMNQIKVLPFSEKVEWSLNAKYSLGTKSRK